MIAVGGTGIFTMINLLNKSQSGSSEILEMITNPGTATSKGNSCPNGYAYVGEGYCREVTCTYHGYSGGENEELISGKKWRCPTLGIVIKERFSLTFGPQLCIGNNPDCPSGEPKKGWSSTCEKPYEEPPKDQRIFGRRIKN